MKTLKSKFCRSAPSVCCIKLHEINETEMTNARCCLYQIASVWICRFFFFFFGRNIIYIVSWSTNYITENHMISSELIQKILNFKEAEKEFWYMGFMYWKVWTPSKWASCSHSPKPRVESCSKIHNLCQI